MRFAPACILAALSLVPEDAWGFTVHPRLNSLAASLPANEQRIGQQQQESQVVGWQPSRLSAVAAEVNGASTTAVAESPTSESESPDLSIRLNVNEKARTVASVCTSGTLCTQSSQDGIEGAPFGSYVDYVLDDDGNPVLLMNEMSMHTVNIRDSNSNNKEGEGDSMVSLFAQLGNTQAGTEGQDISRCSVTGTIERIDDTSAPDIDILKMRYAIAHSYADQVMDSPRFHFYRLKPAKVYFVGGFGVQATWVDVDEYRDATPDILAKEAGDIIRKLNSPDQHGDDLLLTAEHLLDCKGVKRIRVTAVDRLGMDIRVTKQGPRANKLITDEFRIGFRIPVISVEDAKSEILKVFQEAWEKANGYDWGDEEAPGSTVPVMKIAEDGLS